MNKKAGIVHWIVFGVVAAIGFFLLLNADLEAGIQTKGAWQISYLRAFQDAEKDLLLIDQTTREAVKLTAESLTTESLAGDLGCGKDNGYTLWNNKEGFCNLKIEDKFKEKFNSLVEEKTKIKYDEFIISQDEIVGKSNQQKAILSSFELIPIEDKSAGMFTDYKSFIIKPFYLRYEYNPSFRVKATGKFAEFKLLFSQAQILVDECKSKSDLKNCLDQQKETNWHYSSCLNIK